MKVLYYYYYLFYTKILPDDEPHATTVFTLSVSEGFFINGILQIFLARFFCMPLNIWPMIGVLVLLIFLNYFYYQRSGRAKEIVKTKPMFYSNHKFSIVLTLLFFIVTSSFLFWEPVYIKQIMENYCR